MGAVVALVLGTLLLSIVDSGTRHLVGGVVRILPLVLLAALAAPVLVWIARRPQRGILLVAAFVPYYGLLLIVPHKPPFAEGWKEALTLYTLVWAFVRSPRRSGARGAWPKVVQPMLAYAAIGIASAVFIAPLVQGAVGIKVDYFWLLLALAAWQCPLDASDRDRLVSIVMCDALVTSLVGLAQQAVGHARLYALGYQYNSTIRFTGRFLRSFSTFATPFNFAFFLAFALIVTVPVCLEDRARLRNRLFLFTTPIVLVALAFTFVRGAWLEVGVAAMYLAVRRYRVLLLLAPLAVVALLVLPGQFSASALSDQSLQERSVGWSQNLSHALSRPVGNGIGTTGASGQKATQVEGTTATTFVYEPDNQYYKALYELGVFGLWMLVFLLVSVLVESRRCERVLAGTDLALACATSGLVLGAMVASAVSTWLEIFPNDMYLWLVLTVVVTAAREPQFGRVESALVRTP